jgi:hypothetical protein
VKTPYDNWQSIFSAVGTVAPGPLPSDSSTSTTSTSAKASSTPRPEYAQVCTPHQEPNVGFTRAGGVDAINRGCDLYMQIVIPDGTDTIQIIFNQEDGHKTVQGTLGWSKAGQDGCNKTGTNQLSADDCQKLFTAAMDNCKCFHLEIGRHDADGANR